MKTQTINEVKLRARLGKDAEMKTLSIGGEICKLIVCTETSYKNQDGAFEKQAEWHTVIVKGSKAQAAGRFRKGEMIDVSGRLRTRSFDVNGEKRYITEVLTFDARPVLEQGHGEVNGNVADFRY